MHMIRRFFLVLLLCCGAWQDTAASPMAFIDTQIAAHPGQTGAYVLDTGEEALLARAWLADHAQRSDRGAVLHLEHATTSASWPPRRCCAPPSAACRCA